VEQKVFDQLLKFSHCASD